MPPATPALPAGHGRHPQATTTITAGRQARAVEGAPGDCPAAGGAVRAASGPAGVLPLSACEGAAQAAREGCGEGVGVTGLYISCPPLCASGGSHIDWASSSVVEQSTADRQVSGSIPEGPLLLSFWTPVVRRTLVHTVRDLRDPVGVLGGQGAHQYGRPAAQNGCRRLPYELQLPYDSRACPALTGAGAWHGRQFQWCRSAPGSPTSNSR